MYNINIKMDTVNFKRKPTSVETAQINNRISEKEAEEIKWTDFCYLVGLYGYSFCVADFKGERRKENFKSQKLFALDFDNTVKYSVIKERAEKYHLPIALAYETFSSVDLSNFRIVFILNQKIENLKKAETITKILMSIFPECDKKCSDSMRIFFGGKRIIESSETDLSIDTLNMEYNKFHKDTFGYKHYKENIAKIAEKENLQTKNGFILIENKSFETDFTKIRHFSFANLIKSCQLYREFESGDRWLYHNELMGILTNMVNIDGGNRRFLGIAEKENNAEYKYMDKDLRYYINYMNKMRYKPQKCDNFCPYKDVCKHSANMINTVKTQQHSVTKFKDKKYFSIDEAFSDLKTKLNNAIESNENKITVIKAQTAIGKTHCYVNLVKNSDKLFVIAVPTNILKDEVYERLISEGVNGAVKTYSIQEVEEMQNEIGCYVKKLNSLGAHKDVVEYLKKIAKEENNPHYLDYIKPLCDYYTEGTKVIVTTHKKLMGANEDFLSKFEVIIDEDILITSSKNSYEVKIKDLLKLEKNKKITSVLNSTDEFISTKPINFQISYKEMMKCGITSTVNAFFSAAAILKGDTVLNCFVPPKLPNIKLTVLSATAEKEIYELFCKDRIIQFEECLEAKYKGKILQNCSRSYSRQDIDKQPDFFEKIKEEYDDCDYIITFMKYKDEADGCVIHFGNTEGCDCMKGKNIAVIGTPHYNEIVYKLIGCHVNADVSSKMRFQEVEDECFRYWLNTYKEPILRKIQLWILKSELIQAVGRARLLRYDCTVKLFASIPLEQAVIE